MASAHQEVLVVDDEPDMARCLADVIGMDDFHVMTAASSAEALAACRGREFGVVVTDVQMEGMSGLELLSRMKRLQPSVPVILITAHATVGEAVDALQRGAFDYLTKPCDADRLRTVVSRAASQRAPPPPSAAASTPWSSHALVGESAAMHMLRARIDLVAASPAPVLITGETGTGKELAARAIHAKSSRAKHPFVTVNTSAIPEALLESEMFGHVRGAFTGATRPHRGYFARAQGGTLLLDEIGDMPLSLQAKLLRAIQTGEIAPVGSERTEPTDVRLLAATNRNLVELVRAGQFREDLYYRLNVLNVGVAPLRKRTADIPSLAAFFLQRARERNPTAVPTTITGELDAVLMTRPWRGNVRELESAIERLAVLVDDAELRAAHLPLVDDPPPSGLDVADDGAELATLDELVRRHVDRVLQHTRGNKPSAAKILQIDLSTLYRWQQKWRT